MNILQTCLSSTSLFFSSVILNLSAKVFVTNVITLRRVIWSVYFEAQKRKLHAYDLANFFI